MSSVPPPPPFTPRPALAAGPIAVVLAHADGFNWDEALLVLAPIAVLAAVLLWVNRKLQRGIGSEPEPGDARPASDEDHPAGA